VAARLRGLLRLIVILMSRQTCEVCAEKAVNCAMIREPTSCAQGRRAIQSAQTRSSSVDVVIGQNKALSFVKSLCPTKKDFFPLDVSSSVLHCSMIRRPAKTARRKRDRALAGLQEKAVGHQKGSS